ncbi:F0F1 ATP synthase subunit B [uncultured Eubacterium sp.]|uniref:F0F1 ATP synthase subunit B n=1 Tax=uncultured Eubacterium sp. TaxID=165185 RepID=UPI0025F51151|nr:F0F1 ATP synthase subunit B [uncultured Eubacterium sp.]
MLKFDFNLLWTIFNLIIFYLLMRLFLIKPIKKTLQARKELIDNQFKEAEDTVNAANEKMADYEDKIKNVDTEAKEIISDARDKAKVEYNKILDKANDDAVKMKQEAQKQIKQDTENARRDVKEELAKLAMETAQKVVGESVNAQTDADIYNKFLNESSED